MRLKRCVLNYALLNDKDQGRDRWKKLVLMKIPLLWGLMKFKIFFLKVEYEGELQISELNLFHSTNTDGKKNQEKR